MTDTYYDAHNDAALAAVESLEYCGPWETFVSWRHAELIRKDILGMTTVNIAADDEGETFTVTVTVTTVDIDGRDRDVERTTVTKVKGVRRDDIGHVVVMNS